ncbi:hypothetical protein E1301_Tti013963 [Triplophysa tibetana]|uniref:Uncharacterized protein n=1 Tax=Triplophysa tibetana TaxID=1572043 RepID=A0A5A9NC74_9TELE|nr:hypothetical protein E1301_Tti013963 [Triplophysa tibetana]
MEHLNLIPHIEDSRALNHKTSDLNPYSTRLWPNSQGLHLQCYTDPPSFRGNTRGHTGFGKSQPVLPSPGNAGPAVGAHCCPQTPTLIPLLPELAIGEFEKMFILLDNYILALSCDRGEILSSLPTLSGTPQEHLTSLASFWQLIIAMATNRERQVGHMTGFPPAVYPFAFNTMRSHPPFDLLTNSSLFGRFGADLPKEMAALCEYCT